MTDAVAWHSANASDFDGKYATSSAFRERRAVWSGLIDAYVGSQAEVLDAGCGSGVLTSLAAARGRAVFGFDGSGEMVALARARLAREGRGNAGFATAFLEDPALLGARRFDVVLCSSVLEYVEDHWRAFDWLAAALKPDGTVIFSMPNGSSVYRKLEKLAFRLTGRPGYYANVRHVPTAAAIQAGLAARGFELLAVRYYAAAPLFSALARPLGRPELGDNLFVMAVRRAASAGRA